MNALAHLAHDHAWRQMWLFGMSSGIAAQIHRQLYPECLERPEHKHEWRDTGFANLDDCEFCEATRVHPE